MARAQTLETWTKIFDLVERATEHHQAAERLQRLAASCDTDVRAGLAARARLRRRLGDQANATADKLRHQRYDHGSAPTGRAS